MEVKGNSLVDALHDRKLVVFTGKGGVGKTSVAAAFARVFAQAGRRVLAAEMRSTRRLLPLLSPALAGQATEGDGPLAAGPGITWINFTPAAALETYALKMLRFRSVYRAVFEQRAVRQFLRAVPALAEILVLGHLVHLLEERDDVDLAVLDAPSTGPGALLFASPGAVMAGAPRGPLREGAAWIQRFLTDASRTAVNLVVIPEELPVSEAIELYHRLRDDVQIPLGAVIVNRTLPDPFAGFSDVDVEAATESFGNQDNGRELAAAASLWRARLRLQESYLDRLAAGVDLDRVHLPEMFERADGAGVVAGLAAALGGEPGEAS